MVEIPFVSAAREEFLAAADDYDAASAGLGEEFIAEVEKAVARIASFPDHGSAYYSGTRRIVLRRFPYDIVYRESSTGLVVIAVAHHRRRPFYWRNRA